MAMRGVYTLRKPLGLRLRIRQAALIRIRLSEKPNRIWQECQEHQAAETTRFAWEGLDIIVLCWRKMILEEYSRNTTSILLVFHTEVHVDVLRAHLG